MSGGAPTPGLRVIRLSESALPEDFFLVFPFHRKCNFWIQWGRLNAADSRLTNWGVFAFVEITETKICLLIMLLTLRKLLLWHSGWRWSHWKWLQKILPIPCGLPWVKSLGWPPKIIFQNYSEVLQYITHYKIFFPKHSNHPKIISFITTHLLKIISENLQINYFVGFYYYSKTLPLVQNNFGNYFKVV